ncbi:hypothetical protein LN42_07365 [Marinitoga sp. 1137]|nr:hypothetical protein LN42_07365 [Marinitoga sp. 1137]
MRKKDIFDNSYDIYIERQIPENVKVINIQLEKQNKYKNFFQGIDFDVDELWKEKNFLPESEILKFAGVVENEGNLIGYVYIGNQLIKLKNGEIKNDKRVIKIFKDGILLYDNNKKRFEVLR